MITVNIVFNYQYVMYKEFGVKIDGNLNERAIVSELSLRLKQYRIDSAITREELANKSMVSVGTIARFENGHEIGLSNLVKLITALGLVNNLELLIHLNVHLLILLIRNQRKG